MVGVAGMLGVSDFIQNIIKYLICVFEPYFAKWEGVIREVREETRLTIKEPKFCGIYHWFVDSVHQIVYIYLVENL